MSWHDFMREAQIADRADLRRRARPHPSGLVLALALVGVISLVDLAALMLAQTASAHVKVPARVRHAEHGISARITSCPPVLSVKVHIPGVAHVERAASAMLFYEARPGALDKANSAVRGRIDFGAA